MRTPLNTIDRCFREAQGLLIAKARADREVLRAYSIFARLRPIFAPWMTNDELVLVALAIWRARGKAIQECRKCRNRELRLPHSLGGAARVLSPP